MSAPPELQVAERAAAAGAEIVSKYARSGIAMRSKRGPDLVSDADVESERAIVAVLRDAFPDHEILAEEDHAGDHRADHLWVVDPLDGTNNFAHGIPHFAVSVAYYRDGQAECGVIVNPMRDDWYRVVRGRGATLNGQAIRVADENRLENTMVGLGFYYDRGPMMEATLRAIEEFFHRGVHGIRRFGTASLDLCMVASGMFGAFFEFELSPWDFAAGRLVVEEAGGRVTDCRGAPLPLQRSSVLASNGPLHEAALAIVRRHVPDRPAQP